VSDLEQDREAGLRLTSLAASMSLGGRLSETAQKLLSDRACQGIFSAIRAVSPFMLLGGYFELEPGVG